MALQLNVGGRRSFLGMLVGVGMLLTCAQNAAGQLAFELLHGFGLEETFPDKRPSQRTARRSSSARGAVSPWPASFREPMAPSTAQPPESPKDSSTDPNRSTPGLSSRSRPQAPSPPCTPSLMIAATAAAPWPA